MDLVETACGVIPVPNGGETIGLPPEVAICVAKVLGAVELAMKTACGSTAATTCVSNLVTQIDTLLRNACGILPFPDGGTTIGLPPGVAECVIKTLGAVNLVMETACGSTAAATCVDNLITRIDTLLQTACGTLPVPDGGSTIGLPPGVAECVIKALGAVNLVMEIACRSTTATTCVDNLVIQIDTLLQTACGTLPVPAGGDTNGVPPGVSRCVEAVLGSLELLCGTSQVSECIDLLIQRIGQAVGAACDGDQSGTVVDSSLACVAKAREAIALVMFTVRLASELLTQNLPGNPSASRPLLASSYNGWYTLEKEGEDGQPG
ncbi:MAG: hypothetical protein ACR2KQ_05820, partial [Actinomycetota bacterium]